MENYKLTFYFALCGIFSAHFALAQVGGQQVYKFLNLSPSARVTALGGSLITAKDDDVALAAINPALLNANSHQQLSFNHNLHLAGIQNGYVAYGHHFSKLKWTMMAGVQYVNYGKFDGTDEFGQPTSDFKAAEFAFCTGASRQLSEHLSVGANVKLISSQFETYRSLGLAADAAAVYYDSTSRFLTTLVFRNVGGQFSTYHTNNREKIPFEIQAGVSKKLRYLPFRVSIIAHNLQRWDLRYENPNEEENSFFLDETTTERNKSAWIDNIFRHLIFSGEFLLGKKENLRLRVGYNHFLRKELNVANFRSLSGFAFGFGVKIKRFRIDYGRGIYHLAGGVNHFSISTNLQEFK